MLKIFGGFLVCLQDNLMSLEEYQMSQKETRGLYRF